jgi:hypothetical protein
MPSSFSDYDVNRAAVYSPILLLWLVVIVATAVSRDYYYVMPSDLKFVQLK